MFDSFRRAEILSTESYYVKNVLFAIQMYSLIMARLR
jgi:hypothetical protein